MAEEKKQNITTVNVHGGMALYMDTSPEGQPQNTYSFMIGGMLETPAGDHGFPSIEISNRVYTQLPADLIPIGNTYIGRGRLAVAFSSLDETYQELGILSRDGTWTAHVQTTALGFKLYKQIELSHRNRLGCEDTVYWVDDLNVNRYFNFSQPEDFYSEALEAHIDAGNDISTFVGERWDASKFALNRPYKIPCIQEATVQDGGILPVGSYSFGIFLADSDLNNTPAVTTTNAVNIYYDDDTKPYDAIAGAYDDDVSEELGKPDTSKSIKLELTNLDDRFEFFRLVVIRAISGTGEVTDALVSPEIPITVDEFIFDGNLEGWTEIPVSDLLPGKTDLETAAHISQLENRLILASTRGKAVNWCDFQPFASRIGSYYKIDHVPANSVDFPGNPKSPNTVWEKMSEMGGDVTAWAIVYVFDDGFESPAFHIPGPGLTRVWDHEMSDCKDRALDPNGTIETWTADIQHIYPGDTAEQRDEYNDLPSNQKLRNWQIYDMSEVVTGDPLTEETTGILGYHQTKNTEYEPRNTECTDNYWGNDICGIPLQGSPVRHHRMPMRSREPHIIGGGTVETGEAELTISLEVVAPSGNTTLNAIWTGGISIIVNWDKNGVPQPAYSPAAFADVDAALTALDGLVLDTSDDAADFTNVVVTLDRIDPPFTGETDTSNIEAVTNTETTPEIIFSLDISADGSGDLINDDLLRMLGICFHNVEYPHPDIVSHYFVRADRNNFNREVMDTAIVGNLRRRNTTGPTYKYRAFTHFTAENGSVDRAETHLYVFSPRFMYDRDVMNPTHIRLMGRTGDPVKIGHQYERFDGSGGRIKETDLRVESRIQRYRGVDISAGQENYSVEKGMIMDAGAFDDNYGLDDEQRFFNFSLTNRLHVMTVERDHTAGTIDDSLGYFALIQDIDVHPFLDSIKYFKAHNCAFTAQDTEDTFDVFGGDTFITPLFIANSHIRKLRQSPWAKILGAILIGLAAVATAFTAGAAAGALAPLSAAASAVFFTTLAAGAIGLTSTVASAIITTMDKDNGDQVVEDTVFNGLGSQGSSYLAFGNEVIWGTYVESTVNTGLRTRGNGYCQDYYDGTFKHKDYFRNQLTYWDEEAEKWFAKGLPCPEYYDYNKDFIRRNKQKEYFPLRRSFDCCSECLEYNPSRVHYSLQSFQEEVADVYRQLLPNNYRDVEAEQGVITGLSRMGNSLFIHTSEGLWRLPQSYQQQVTDELVTFLGTGEFFSIPPRRVMHGEVGAGGCVDKWSILETDIGIVYVDREDGHVYLIGPEKKAELTGPGGVRTFFQKHVPMVLSSQYLSLTGEIFPNDPNPANPSGVGFTATYDKRYQRIIFTKKDYEILDTGNFSTEAEATAGQLFFDTVLRRFKVKGAEEDTVVYLDNVTYFRNRSWTFSFSTREDSMGKPIGFHHYLPNHYMYTQDTFISYAQGNDNLWAHDDIASYGNFYGERKGWTIELISLSSPLPSRITEHLMYQTIAKKYSPADEQWYDQRLTTFNKITCYNSYQCSGELTIVVKDSVANPEDYIHQQIQDDITRVIADINERDWTINDLKDYVDNYDVPFFTSSWQDIAASYFIDKVVNSAALNTSRDWDENRPFMDKFLIIRLTFDNLDDVNLTFKAMLEAERPSFR